MFNKKLKLTIFRHLAPWYGDDPVSYCNRIAGTDGQTVPAGTTVNDILDIFVSDLTMTIWMTHGASDTYRIFGKNCYNKKSDFSISFWFRQEIFFIKNKRSKRRC